MQFKFKFIVGETAFEISDTAESPQEFFEKVSFWQDLPTEGPNRERDLSFRHRKTPSEGYDYYSIVCKSAGQEYRFGQSKKEPGMLFPKGWTLLGTGQDHPEEIDQPPRTERQASNGDGRRQPAPPPAEKASNTTGAQKVTSTTFWAYQKAQGIAKVTATEIIDANTQNNVTNWQRAFAELQQAG